MVPVLTCFHYSNLEAVPIMGQYHDDVIKWKHFSALLALCAGNHRSQMNSSHKGQWRRALMFSLICSWINGWVNKSWGWWFEMPSCPLWRPCNVVNCFVSNSKLNYHEIASIHNIHLSCQTIFKFCMMHAICKSSKWLQHWNICHGQIRFHEIWVLCCRRIQSTVYKSIYYKKFSTKK